MDATTARTMIADAEALIARLKTMIETADLPTEPEFLYPQMRIITFRKQFGKISGKKYTYAALAPRSDHWFITGRRLADFTEQGMTWRQLMEFMVSEEAGYTRCQVIDSFEVVK